MNNISYLCVRPILFNVYITPVLFSLCGIHTMIYYTVCEGNNP